MATLVYHPLGFLDRLSVPGGYSTRAAAASYQPWVRFVTELAVERGVGGTPTVLVAGIPVPANPQTIAAAVAELAP